MYMSVSVNDIDRNLWRPTYCTASNHIPNHVPNHTLESYLPCNTLSFYGCILGNSHVGDTAMIRQTLLQTLFAPACLCICIYSIYMGWTLRNTAYTLGRHYFVWLATGLQYMKVVPNVWATSEPGLTIKIWQVSISGSTSPILSEGKKHCFSWIFR